ncbi:MAG TPA: 2-amino-4-hydroxy-6-hydroxymethyldihydropteridine diphosphokinase [Rhodocyclaceae bacterium]|nr:2-amino-4-hydroxy-6-hydroxymethyldihydropteridine diphosphokinase [Rhodocyclaceae bacterium]
MIFTKYSAWIGVGSNLGDPIATVRAAIATLGQQPHCAIKAQSSLYLSTPIGVTDQPDYINAVVEIATAFGPHLLLENLLAIEKLFGRVRTHQNAPRTLDLDLLLYVDRIIDQPGLQIPHPRMHERAFVLLPLNEIAPDLIIPGKGAVRDLLAAVKNQAVSRIVE